ncbi:hypothetical protein [Sphingomonas sp. 8AM]|uniref:hypothetical protein n=1 Tax=Sphingomonas sp. 8AM TaxID=2653170 RepID=UPI0012F405A5|nr:hypothetical protein [Sphingomonas sp. 8AM]VXD00896.1 exported hypothetical protein [Sphingomonas sp. 8AM]
MSRHNSLVQYTAVLVALLTTATIPTAHAQTRAGQVAKSAAGEIGQRQTREDAERVTAMGVVNGRVQNRIQSRLRTRIDRFYNPRANALSAFAVANDEERRGPNKRR